MHALRCEVIDLPRSIAQTKQKHCRGIPGEVCWGERFSSGKLRHHISEQEREVT
jgi:hypothetical protein